MLGALSDSGFSRLCKLLNFSSTGLETYIGVVPFQGKDPPDFGKGYENLVPLTEIPCEQNISKKKLRENPKDKTWAYCSSQDTKSQDPSSTV